MNKLEFWEIIKNQNIKSTIKDFDLNKLLSFQDVLASQIRELFIPQIGEIFYLIQNLKNLDEYETAKYISTDGFLDFRAWIISCGKTTFIDFLTFKHESKILKYQLSSQCYNPDLPFLVENIIDSKFEEKDKTNINYHFDNDYDQLYSKIQWDQLYDKYDLLISHLKTILNEK